jgi:thiamine-phosphate pyrophosphorylase
MVNSIQSMLLPRVYAILDGRTLAAKRSGLISTAEAVLEAGVKLIQIRWKDTWTREVYRDAVTVAGLCRESSARLIVNDRIDMAMLLSAGAHVGQDDLPVSEARKLLGAGAPLGHSTHNESQFTEALSAPVDYIAVGPIFATASKANPDPVVGTGELARLRPMTGLPLVGIGGITRANAPEVWRAGADCVAVIGDLYPPQCTKASVRERAEEWMAIAHEYCD